jgi:hypothetical protein
VQSKEIWLLVIGAVIGWVSGVATNWISLKMTAATERQNVARGLCALKPKLNAWLANTAG